MREEMAHLQIQMQILKMDMGDMQAPVAHKETVALL
jgi:hypothetical protein